MELLFLVNSDHPGPDRSPIKEKELLQSEIKSHAARISHRKRRFLPTYRPTQSQTTAVQVRPNIAAAKSNLEDEKGKKEGDRITILRVPQKGRRKKLIWQPRPATISKGLPGIPISETRDTYATFARPGYKVIFDVFNVRNTLNEDPYYYWNHKPFFLGVASDMQSLREQSLDPKSTARGSTSVSKYMVEAVNALRISLGEQRQVSDINLISIMLLGLCEGRCGHKETNKLHRKSVVRFIQQRGGITQLNGFSRAFISQFEYLLSLGTETSFLAEMLPTLYPQPATTLDPSCLDELPEGFRELARRGKLSRNIVEVIQRAVIVNLATFGKSSVPSYNAYHLESKAKYFSFVEACPELGMKTLPLRSDYSSAPSSSSSSREASLSKLLCLALLLYCCNDLCPVSTASASKTCTRRGLTAELMMCVEPFANEDEEECVFWIWTVALNAWRGTSSSNSSSARGSNGGRRGGSPHGSKTPSSTASTASRKAVITNWTEYELLCLGKRRFRPILKDGYERCSAILKKFLRNPALDLTVLVALASD